VPLGDVLADAQLDATRFVTGAQIALVNPGSIRADLVFPTSPAGEGDGVVTYGEAFAVQPLTSRLVTMTLTGSQLDLLLEQQFCGVNASPSGPRVLMPSAGFTFAYRSGVSGTPDCAVDMVPESSIHLGGVPILPDGEYRVTVNAFLAAGGDGFAVLRDGTDRVTGPFDLDALVGYLTGSSPVSPPPLDRISFLP
jgi:5'-nucleotidase